MNMRHTPSHFVVLDVAKAGRPQKRVPILSFGRGCFYYNLLSGMREKRAKALMEQFYELVQAQPLYHQVFGII